MAASDKSADDLTEACLSSLELEHTRFLKVKRDRVLLPSGHEGEREYIMHPGAVLVIPMLDDGRLVLERQFRYPLRQVFIELPAGKIDPNEDPLVTGQRELQEETGYTASEWIYLAAQHPCIGYSDEIIHIYLARGLAAGQHQRDADEALQIFEADLNACLQMVQRGEITDGKTIIALFWLEKYLQGSWPAQP
ncbi:MAG: NUDIX hydrolase [Betaproteobacteria bacterium HGW-Betaproteobacteria-8]|nr:MAG: NUDIX hydrolase [Betaproteobacteria bacterium HGW-Betaproteobacteria-8]